MRWKRLTESRKSTTSVASGLPSGRTHRTMSIGLFLLHFRPAWRKYARYTTQCKQSTDPGPMSVMLVRPGVSGFGSCGSGGSNLGGSPGHCPDLGLWSRLSLSRRRAARRPDLIRRGGHLRQTLACQTILSLVHLTETPAGSGPGRRRRWKRLTEKNLSSWTRQPHDLRRCVLPSQATSIPLSRRRT